MSGHVFVVKGDVRKIRCDARLVPAYNLDMPNQERWFRQDIGEEKLARPKPASSSERSEGVRLLGALDGGPALWAVKVGQDAVTKLDDAMLRVSRFLERAWEALTPSGGQVDISKLPSGRSKPLFAMPVVGTGKRNFDRASGAAIDQLLKLLSEAVAERDFDVVIVAREEEKYSALQVLRSRSRGNTAVLPKHLDEVATRLAERAAAGELSVLLGAGLSMNAGLPSWRGLLDAVAARLGLRTSEPTENLLAFAQCLEQYVGPRRFRDEIKAVCTAPRHALGHALLASSPVRAFVTLNYDTMLEDAANHKENPGGGAITVIPHGTLKPQSRWLLKLHGSVTTPDDIVITERDYAKFHEWRAAFKGVVQAQLITGHMLFVGFGMSDDNMSQVLDTVASAVANDASKKEEKVGTVLWFPDASTEGYAQKYPLEFAHLGEPMMTNEERARRCEILLDEVMRRAEKGIGHLLDARFDELPGAKPEARRALAEFLTSFKKNHGDSALYEELRKRLEPLGYVDSSGSDASSSASTPGPSR